MFGIHVNKQWVTNLKKRNLELGKTKKYPRKHQAEATVIHLPNPTKSLDMYVTELENRPAITLEVTSDEPDEKLKLSEAKPGEVDTIKLPLRIIFLLNDNLTFFKVKRIGFYLVLWNNSQYFQTKMPWNILTIKSLKKSCLSYFILFYYILFYLFSLLFSPGKWSTSLPIMTHIPKENRVDTPAHTFSHYIERCI